VDQRTKSKGLIEFVSQSTLIPDRKGGVFGCPDAAATDSGLNRTRGINVESKALIGFVPANRQRAEQLLGKRTKDLSP
jgi:hypothetical protein